MTTLTPSTLWLGHRSKLDGKGWEFGFSTDSEDVDTSANDAAPVTIVNCVNISVDVAGIIKFTTVSEDDLTTATTRIMTLDSGKLYDIRLVTNVFKNYKAGTPCTAQIYRS